MEGKSNVKRDTSAWTDRTEVSPNPNVAEPTNVRFRLMERNSCEFRSINLECPLKIDVALVDHFAVIGGPETLEVAPNGV